MKNNALKLPLALSLSLHAGLFLILALHFKKPQYLMLPVELTFYGVPYAAPEAKETVAEKKIEKEIIKKTDGDVVVSKKKAKSEKKEEKQVAAQKVQPVQSTQSTQSTQSLQGAHFGTGAAGSKSQINLESANFPFTYYTNTIVKKIGRNWQWSTAFGQIKAVVYFKIRRDGSIFGIKIKETSGDSTFDQQALRSVAISSPFPPLPDTYTEDDLGVFFEFSFRE